MWNFNFVSKTIFPGLKPIDWEAYGVNNFDKFCTPLLQEIRETMKNHISGEITKLEEMKRNRAVYVKSKVKEIKRIKW